jgi:hypothetical protein
MTEIGFSTKEVIASQISRLEILDVGKADTYGPQIYLKLKVVGGEYDGHTFNDYANRDEATGNIKQGSKAWTIFEACLGKDFHKQPGVSLESLVGKQFVAQVTQTRTGSRNKVEFGTIGPVPPEEKCQSADANSDEGDDVDFSDLRH